MFFRRNKALLLAGTKLKSTYKSLELTTATRLPTAGLSQMQLQKYLEQYQKLPKSVVVHHIGERAGTFFGMRRIFARILPNLPEISSIKKWPPKRKLFMLFSAPFLLIFSGVCSCFQGFCEGFQRFCPDFHGFFPDFHQGWNWEFRTAGTDRFTKKIRL